MGVRLELYESFDAEESVLLSDESSNRCVKSSLRHFWANSLSIFPEVSFASGSAWIREAA